MRLSGPCGLVAEKHTQDTVYPTGVCPEPRMMAPRGDQVCFCRLGRPESSLMEDKGCSRP